MKQFICSLLLIFSVTAAHAAVTNIILVRHAEKVLSPNKMMADDPDLTDAGKARAKALAHLTDTFEISGVYSSNYKRTIQTAAPLAEKLHLKINSSIEPDKYQDLLKDILTNYGGKTVFVVGHSDTVPGFINSVSKNTDIKEIDPKDYSNLFILQYDSVTKKATLEKFVQTLSQDRLLLH